MKIFYVMSHRIDTWEFEYSIVYFEGRKRFVPVPDCPRFSYLMDAEKKARSLALAENGEYRQNISNI